MVCSDSPKVATVWKISHYLRGTVVKFFQVQRMCDSESVFETFERRSAGWRCNTSSSTFFSVLTHTACCAGHEARHVVNTTYGSKPCHVVFDHLSLLIS